MLMPTGTGPELTLFRRMQLDKPFKKKSWISLIKVTPAVNQRANLLD